MIELFVRSDNKIWMPGYPLLTWEIFEWCHDTFGPPSPNSKIWDEECRWAICDCWMSSASLGPVDFCRLQFKSNNDAVLFKMKWL